MSGPEGTLLVLLAILSFGLIIPELIRKLKIPFITTLILLGAILGPNGIDYIQSNEVIEFFGFLGMTFLMLMAGLETDLSKLKQIRNKLFVLVGFNTIIPFIVGVSITRLFGYSWLTSFLIGVIFVSSSMAIVIPSLKLAGIFHKAVGQMILSAVLIADVLSLILLSFILQTIDPITKLP
ncbi:MAG: cation:proton antiporter, partial [Nanoarchaeota archaeon]|nr:cation:proton antiporter [Nanoarchaeota archaeon]